MFRIASWFASVLLLTQLPVCVCPAHAAPELPAVFSDHMILQRELPIKIWGWSEPGETIVCQLGDRSATISADAQGTWSLTLKPMPAGGPHTLSVSAGQETVRVEDVYIGEVWLCSGQSNMAMTVNRALDYDREAAAAKYPLIRMFKESSPHALRPQDKSSGTWTVCGPDTVGGFSATAYFFGRRVHEQLQVPVGLINSSVGGTSIESWTSMSAQQGNPAVAPILESWNRSDQSFDAGAARANYERALAQWEKRRDAAKAAGRPAPRRPVLAVQPRTDRNHPANLFNGKIHPLVGYGIRGGLWYQGERNANGGLSHLYGKQLETLIADWRARWGQGDFPFAWAQLPNFRAPQTQPTETSGWVQVREGMLQTLRASHTGMAITVDVGEADDIHPRNKQAVGERLARWALVDVYKQSSELPHGALAMGPLYESAQRVDKRLRIAFRQAGDTLPKPEGPLRGFAIAGADRKFHWAQAAVVGNAVDVWSDEVPEPVAVRYSWAANPVGNLVNAAGLPASPFRTDDWDE